MEASCPPSIGSTRELHSNQYSYGLKSLLLPSAIARETNAGWMDCKRGSPRQGRFARGGGDLRKNGVATAAKRRRATAREGIIAQCILPGSRVGVLVEINAKRTLWPRTYVQAFCDEIARAATRSQADLEADRVAAVAKIGENIKASRPPAF